MASIEIARQTRAPVTARAGSGPSPTRRWSTPTRSPAGLSNARVRVHLTGLYGHTGASRPPLGAAVRELVTLARVLRLLAL